MAATWQFDENGFISYDVAADGYALTADECDQVGLDGTLRADWGSGPDGEHMFDDLTREQLLALVQAYRTGKV